jgi:hypothetical protein
MRNATTSTHYWQHTFKINTQAHIDGDHAVIDMSAGWLSGLLIHISANNE